MVHWDQEKVKKSLISKLVILMTFALVIIALMDDPKAISGDAGSLKVVEATTLPMHELSGASLRQGADGGFEFIGVSDSKPELLRAQVDERGLLSPASITKGDFGATLVERFSLCRTTASDECADQIETLTTQWEAVATDGIGRVFVVQETTSNVLVFDPSLKNVVAVLSFDLFLRRDGVHTKPGKKGVKSLAEGIILLKNGHVIIAKESFPASLVEFGPAGHEPVGLSAATLLSADEPFAVDTAAGATARVNLVPLASWQRAGESGKCDQSDLATDDEGKLYVLSQKCGNISVYAGLDPTDSHVVPAGLWGLPPKVKNPEALVILPAGRFLVGSDIKSDKPNLFLLEE